MTRYKWFQALSVVLSTAVSVKGTDVRCGVCLFQVYSQHGSLLSNSPQNSVGSEGERTFNLNDSSVPTATQALMTMYRRRSPEEFNPKLVRQS